MANKDSKREVLFMARFVIFLMLFMTTYSLIKGDYLHMILFIILAAINTISARSISRHLQENNKE